MKTVNRCCLLILAVLLLLATTACFPRRINTVYTDDEQPDTSLIAFYPAENPYERGNSNANVLKGGNETIKDGWIYYDTYRFHTDTGEKVEISPDLSLRYYINVVGDWIYYSNFSKRYIYRIRTDGTENTRLNSDISENLIVIGDWIYYQNNSDNGYIYKMRTDGKEKTRINDDSQLRSYSSRGYPSCSSSYFSITNDWIYYLVWTSTSGPSICDLYRIHISGTDKELVIKRHSSIHIIDNDYLYFVDSENNLIRDRLDGTGRILINVDVNILFTVDGDWIYYTDKDNERYMYKMRTDGTEVTQISNRPDCSVGSIVGDWIFYASREDPSDREGSTYRMRTDGTEDQLVTRRY